MGFFLFSGGTLSFPLPAAPGFSVTLTAYNAVPAQTDGDPFTTASGMYSNPDIVAARSRDLAEDLPFGTIIEIDGPTTEQNNCGFNIVEPIVGYRIIADSMNSRFTDRIDILFHTKSNYVTATGKKKNASNILGVCTGVTVRAVGFIDIAHASRIPKTQAELSALVKNGNTLALNK